MRQCAKKIFKETKQKDVHMFGWLFGCYGISAIVGYLTPNLFLCK